MSQTSVEWTATHNPDGTITKGHSENPIVPIQGGWFCTKPSPGCANCYAELQNLTSRFKNGNGLSFTVSNLPEMRLKRNMLKDWAKQRKHKKHFVASMTDWLGEWVPDAWAYEILDAMQAAPIQTFLALSKRSERMAQTVPRWMNERGFPFVAPPNIWLGFSAENQKWFDKRWESIQPLAALGYTIFVSVEPMLGPVVLPDDFLTLSNQGWVIVGGESGPKSRRMESAWVDGIRDQCTSNGVPFFFKQWGGKNKKKAGRLLDGQEWNQMPKVVSSAV
jgi:protein gp37